MRIAAAVTAEMKITAFDRWPVVSLPRLTLDAIPIGRSHNIAVSSRENAVPRFACRRHREQPVPIRHMVNIGLRTAGPESLRSPTAYATCAARKPVGSRASTHGEGQGAAATF